MKQWIAALAVALASASGAASAQYQPPPRVAQFTEDDDRRVVRLPVGTELVVRLSEQAGTPYRWTLRDEYRIREIGDPRVQNIAPPGVVGGTLLRSFRIQVTAGGRIPLKFQLRSTIPGQDRKAVREVRITIDASNALYIPPRPDSDPAPAQIIGEREADGIVSTRQGQLIEIHLPVETANGFHWEVLSSRNVAFEGVVGVEHRPGLFRGLVGSGDMAVIRIRTTVIQADGFLTLVYMPLGQNADRDAAIRTLSYQFNNRR